MRDLSAMAERYSGRGSGKKMARLAPKDGSPANSVRYLIKLHDWSGRAIWVYDLVLSELKHMPRPSDEDWNECKIDGTQVSHPGGIQATDVAAWVKYGREQAARLGYDVA